jgi:hypothetical protein
MSPKATEGVASTAATPSHSEEKVGASRAATPSGRFAAISPSRGEISWRYTNPLFTIMASGEGILPRKAV